MTRMSLLVVFAAFCVALSGCPEQKEPVKPTGNAPAPVETVAPTPDAPPAEAAPEAAPGEKTEKKNGEFNIDFAINYDDNFHSHSKGRFGGILAILGSHQFHAEFIPNPETGDILAILYDDHFKPFKSEAKELTLNLVVEGNPKQFAFLVDFEGSKEKPALYKISDAALAKLLKDGWTGNALVSLSVDDKPVSGRLTPLKK